MFRTCWEHIWDNIEIDEALIMQYFQTIKDYDIRVDQEKTVATPTFLALGLYDSTVPFYSWTEDSEMILKRINHYVFSESGHCPMIEEPGLFANKVKEFVDNLNCERKDESKMRVKP